MCTAVSLSGKKHYFGRNLDLEFSYEEKVVVTPRNYPFSFRKAGELKSHYAMIGVAYMQGNYPLYYDAANEKGLAIAGLNFPGSAHYMPFQADKTNITPFEIIPWILGQCATVEEAKRLLETVNMLDEPFSTELPLTPLHWMISDAKESIGVEPMGDGLHIISNPVGVMTNEPPLEYHLMHLNDYIGISSAQEENRFSEHLPLRVYSRGMGAMGLPGDYSSSSRFVRAAFVKENMPEEATDVGAFFEILESVSVPRGSVQVGDGKYQYTIYSSCCDAQKGIYYYTTNKKRTICAADMHRENLDGTSPVAYSMTGEQEILWKN